MIISVHALIWKERAFAHNHSNQTENSIIELRQQFILSLTVSPPFYPSQGQLIKAFQNLHFNNLRKVQTWRFFHKGTNQSMILKVSRHEQVNTHNVTNVK